MGWINFDPADSQVTIDPATGRFDGYAWGETVGWIHFKNADPAYNVVTEYRPPIPVGGIVVPVNRLGLLALRLRSGQAPWIGLAALVAVGGALLLRARR